MRERSLSLTPLSQPMSPDTRSRPVTPPECHTPIQEDSDSDIEDDNHRPRGERPKLGLGMQSAKMVIEYGYDILMKDRCSC